MINKVTFILSRCRDYLFYRLELWRCVVWLEKRFLLNRVIKPLQLQEGLRILDLGCGNGFFSALFSELGFEVVGVDKSTVSISYAKRHFPKPSFLYMDAHDLQSEFKTESFDVIFARGMSWYHYELNGINRHGVDVPNCTRGLFRFLKKKGIFIFQGKTDFSGSRINGKIHNNKLEDYVNLFKQMGEIILISGYTGKVLRDDRDIKKAKRGIIIATRK